MLEAFEKAERRDQKVQIKRAIVQRANRAKANSRDTRLTPETRSREASIASILNDSKGKMVLAPKVKATGGNASNRWVKQATPDQKRAMGGKCEYPGCGETRLSELEFVHIEETPISRTGPRGRKEKLADVHAHPEAYKLECHKHHVSDPEAVEHDARMREKGAR